MNAGEQDSQTARGYTKFVGMRIIERNPATRPARAGVIVGANRRRALVQWDDDGVDGRLWATIEPELADLANVRVLPSGGTSSRRKGLRGEQEVTRTLRAAGLEVRNLEGSGDHLTATAGGRLLHIETKRQERLQLPQWLRQAADEAPRGAVPLVVFRQSRGQWYACLPLDSLLEVIGTDDARSDDQ